jgi:hypothetical protein
LGDINRQRSITFPKNRGFAETTAYDIIDISHTYFSFGMQYKEVFDDKFYFTIGATYDLETSLNGSFNSSVINKFPGITGYSQDTIRIDPEYDITNDDAIQNITIPAKIGVGLALGIPNKLTVTADYYTQDWASANNSSLSAEGFDLASASSLHAGLEYIPDMEAFRGYHNLMSYRLGGFWNESYVKIGDYQLQDYGITFGVGLPLGKTKSSLNIAFTYGTRGTIENNLVKENYGILTFNVTLHDLWFYKRKFD